LRGALQEKGLLFGYGASAASSSATPSRAKKTAHASEQYPPDILKRRQARFNEQLERRSTSAYSAAFAAIGLLGCVVQFAGGCP
jgi:hypothetical protein